MENDTTVQDKKKQKIDAIQPSDEDLTSRAGLMLITSLPPITDGGKYPKLLLSACSWIDCFAHAGSRWCLSDQRGSR